VLNLKEKLKRIIDVIGQLDSILHLGIGDELKQLPLQNVSNLDVIGGTLLLTVGGITLGYGLASFDFVALGLALSISGGAMLFGGTWLGARSAHATTKAFNDATDVINEASAKLNDLNNVPIRLDFNVVEINLLKAQVASLQADLKKYLNEKIENR
jgi:hypothetical protein